MYWLIDWMAGGRESVSDKRWSVVCRTLLDLRHQFGIPSKWLCLCSGAWRTGWVFLCGLATNPAETSSAHFHPFSLTLGYPCLKILTLCFSLAFQDSSQAIPLVVESCIRFISRHGKQDYSLAHICAKLRTSSRNFLYSKARDWLPILTFSEKEKQLYLFA